MATDFADEEEVVVETREVSPSHFLFKIKSFSKLSDKGITKYESTNFVVGDYKWRLVIYPNGRRNGNKDDFISVYLAVADTTSLPATWEVHAVFSIFLMNQKLDNFLSIRGRTRRFHAMNPEWGFSKLISKESFRDPSNGYLVDDNCVFGAEVFAIKSQLAKIQCLSILDDKDPYKHSISISNFSKLPDRWESEKFVLGGHMWSLAVNPRGDDVGKGKDNVSTFLKLVDSKSSPCQQLNVTFTIRIKSQVSDNHSTRTTTHWFLPEGGNWGWSAFIPVKDMHDRSKGFLVGDCCIVEVEILFKATVENKVS